MIRRGALLAGFAALGAMAVLMSPAADGAPARPPTGGIAVVGDFGSGTASERAVADLVSSAEPTAIVSTGDNVYGSADYASLVGDYYGSWVAEGSFLPALGNHDYVEGIDAYDAYFVYLKGQRAYTRVVGDVQFYVLDSDQAIRSARDLAWQRGWLSRWVPRSKARWQVVVLHHPPFSSGSVHGSTASLQWPYRSWGVDLVLSGHEHQYERIARGGLSYVVNGAGGKDLYAFGQPVAGSRVRAGHFGALFLSTGVAGLTGEFWSIDGKRLDRFTIPG